MTAELNLFIGRERERQALRVEILQGARLLSVTAPSGMGKTRLVRKVLADVEEAFRGAGGAWFCSLASARDPLDLQAVVSQVLGIPQRQGRHLGNAIASRGKLLLVLDNLEVVARQAAPLLRAWLQQAPQLQILVTSLIPLDIEGEITFELLPLSSEEAVQLYLDRAHRSDAQRPLPAPDREALPELVQRLDRIPLAIELAAARVRILPPRLLLSRISERFTLLCPRQPGKNSLLDAISLSWELLSPAEQRTLARASVFEGGFTLEAAEQVLAPGDGSIYETLDGLRSKALLQVDDSPTPRFSLYESVRAFAQDRLRGLGEEAETLGRHAAHFLAVGEAQAKRADGPQAPEAIRWLLAERENLFAAHRHSLSKDPDTAARLGLVLAVVLALQAPPSQEEELLHATVDAARAGSGAWLPRALLARALASRRRGVLEDARRDLNEAIEAARASEDLALESFARSAAAEVLARLGEAEAARAEITRARELGERAGDAIARAWSMLMGAISQIQWDEYGQAVENLQQALPIFRRHGHLRHEGAALLNLGVALTSQIRYREGRQALLEARKVFARLGDVVSDSVAIVNLAALDGSAGRLDEAERAAMEGLALQRKLGNRRVETVALGNLGIIALERGHVRLAEQRLQEAITALQEWGERRLHGIFLAFLAVAEAMGARWEEAARTMEAARAELGRAGGRGLALIETLEALVRLAQPAGTDAAATAAGHALARERLARAKALGPAGDISGALAIAIRLLEAALQRRKGAAHEASVAGAPAHREEKHPTPALCIGPEASWFALQGDRVEMGRRDALRRILLALVEQRLLAPGVGIARDELARIGWPGERILPKAAWNRTRTAVSTLRSLGLAPALLRQADGYLLDPALPIHRHH